MVAYSFQKRFEAPIRANAKRHTIRVERAGRSRHARPGERLQLYVGMRTSSCRLIATPVCDRVWPIRIDFEAGGYGGSTIVIGEPGGVIADNSGALDPDAFAVSDGFTDWDDMAAFWARHHPGVLAFSGVMIGWAPILPEDLRPQATGGGRWTSSRMAA